MLLIIKRNPVGSTWAATIFVYVRMVTPSMLVRSMVMKKGVVPAHLRRLMVILFGFLLQPGFSSLVCSGRASVD